MFIPYLLWSLLPDPIHVNARQIGLAASMLKICAGKGMANGFKLWADSCHHTRQRSNGNRTCLKGVAIHLAEIFETYRHPDVDWRPRKPILPLASIIVSSMFTAFTRLYSKHWTNKERDREADSWRWCYCLVQKLVTVHFMNLHDTSSIFGEEAGCTSKSRSTPAGRPGCPWAVSSPEDGTVCETLQ